LEGQGDGVTDNAKGNEEIRIYHIYEKQNVARGSVLRIEYVFGMAMSMPDLQRQSGDIRVNG